MNSSKQSPGMNVRTTYEDVQRLKRLETSRRYQLSQSGPSRISTKTERVTMQTEMLLPAYTSRKSIISSRLAALIDPKNSSIGRTHVALLYRALVVLKQIHFRASGTDFGDFYPPEQKIQLRSTAHFDEAEEVLVAKIVNLVDETLNSAEEAGVVTAISSLVCYTRSMDATYGFRRAQQLDIYEKARQAACKTIAKLVRAKGNLADDWDDAKLAAMLKRHLDGRNTRMMEEQLQIRYFRKYGHLAQTEPLPLTAEVLKRAFPQRYSSPAIVFLRLLAEASASKFGMELARFCDEVRFD